MAIMHPQTSRIHTTGSTCETNRIPLGLKTTMLFDEITIVWEWHLANGDGFGVDKHALHSLGELGMLSGVVHGLG